MKANVHKARSLIAWTLRDVVGVVMGRSSRAALSCSAGRPLCGSSSCCCCMSVALALAATAMIGLFGCESCCCVALGLTSSAGELRIEGLLGSFDA